MSMDREPVRRAGMIGGEVQQFGIVSRAAENPRLAQGRTPDDLELQRAGDAKGLMDHHDDGRRRRRHSRPCGA
jgi:hypothetical protein